MSTGVGGTISATKNKLWEATINGKTRRVVPFLNCIENSVCSGAIFSRDSNNNTLDSIFISMVAFLPFCSPPASPLPRNAGWILSLLPTQDSIVLSTEYCARCHSIGMIMLCLLLDGLEMGIILFFTESSKVTADKQPSAGEKGCPLGFGDSLIHVAWCTAQSVLPSVDETLRHCCLREGEGSAQTTDLKAGWNVSWEAMDSSTGLEKWLQIFRLQGHWLPIFHLLWVLFQMLHWTHLPASATGSQLSCSEASGNFWDFNRKTKSISSSPKAQVSMFWRWAPQHPGGLAGEAKASSKPGTKVYSCLAIFSHTQPLLQYLILTCINK